MNGLLLVLLWRSAFLRQQLMLGPFLQLGRLYASLHLLIVLTRLFEGLYERGLVVVPALVPRRLLHLGAQCAVLLQGLAVVHVLRRLVFSVEVLLLLARVDHIALLGTPLYGFLPSLVRGVHELVIHTIVQLAVVVDLVLSVLVPAPRCEFDEGLLLHHRSLPSIDSLELPIIAHT